jgi:hypothetical protein
MRAASWSADLWATAGWPLARKRSRNRKPKRRTSQATHAQSAPCSFLPATRGRYAADGDADGVADPQNLYDSTLAAARYLCSGSTNLRDPAGVMTAILRYNNSAAYAQNVLGWAAAYAKGVAPVGLPPVAGPAPPFGDTHLDHPLGLGPGLPLNIHGLPPNDPLVSPWFRQSLHDFQGDSTGPTAHPDKRVAIPLLTHAGPVRLRRRPSPQLTARGYRLLGGILIDDAKVTSVPDLTIESLLIRSMPHRRHRECFGRGLCLGMRRAQLANGQKNR